MRRTRISILATSLVLFALFFGSIQTSEAQIAASEAGSVSQTVDGTQMSIVYSRPSARGRSPLFGGVMPYGQIITPGANWATTLELSRNVTIEGTPVPAGKYSVWVAFEEGEFEVLLDETWQRFHGPHLVRGEEEYGFSVVPQELGTHLETLTFQFPSVRADGATLRLQWGTTAIDLNIDVEPTPMVNITADEAMKYVGTYSTDVLMKPPFTMFEGTVDVELSYEDGFLQTTMDIGPYTDPHHMAFYPQAELILFPVLLIEGVPAQTFQGGLLFEFNTNASGDVVGFEARLPDDSHWMTGTKK